MQIIFYRAHIRNIHMLGKFSKKQLRIMRNPAKYGNSEVEYPVLSDTPLAIQKFSFTARDPKFNILARDIQPGPTRRFSVSWFYNSPDGKVEKFRISKRILQHHPDLRALDTLVRNNAQQTQTTKPKKNKNKTKKQENASAQIFNV
ncbi:hypothetical protein IW140_005169 [Coemansia sp. RSA 1813]|nr:hypothetical protein IW140_005169 [Coemansia sp. RSA 1813]